MKKRLFLSFCTGLGTVALSGVFLWTILPILFSTILESNAWISWFPLSIALPSLLLGGFVCGRLSSYHRLSLGFSIGVIATGIAILITTITAKFFILLPIIFIGGLLGAAGSHLSATLKSST
jgi:hypothetical protein